MLESGLATPGAVIAATGAVLSKVVVGVRVTEAGPSVTMSWKV